MIAIFTDFFNGLNASRRKFDSKKKTANRQPMQSNLTP